MYKTKDVLATSQLSRSRSLQSLRDISSISSTSDRQIDKVKYDLNAMMEKAFAVFKECEDSTYEFSMNKLILECVREVAANYDKKLSEEMAKKLDTVLMNFDLMHILRIPENLEDGPKQLLGIINVPDVDLNQVEKIEIKNCLEEKLQAKLTSFLKMYKEEGYDIDDLLKNVENGTRERFNHKIGLQHSLWQRKIEEAIRKYEEDLINCYEQMNRWKELKEQKNSFQVQKSAQLEMQAQVTELKAEIGKMICITKMFTEMPITVDAFKILNVMLDDKLEKIDKEVHEKRELKKEYDSLKGTEFDEIVKQYKELCRAIEKKKKLLERL